MRANSGRERFAAPQAVHPGAGKQGLHRFPVVGGKAEVEGRGG